MHSIIQQLDASTANKIAAGEVIDRPSSIVKECIENSIDAHATAITIYSVNGGIDSIQITDNGNGIYKDDLVKAPLRHYTSKIQKIDDIYGIQSFGFRGEALSAICHAAKVSIESKVVDQSAHKVFIQNGKVSEIEPASHVQGTTITITDLFDDLPVRKKFLKRPSTEFLHIYDCVSHFALVFPNIDFRLFHNDSEELNTCGICNTNQLIPLFYGKQLRASLIHFSESSPEMTISGYMTPPTITFSNRSKQICSVNQRIIKNGLILKAIERAFFDYIPARRFPLIVLSIQIHSADLDVNIHPQKLDIKFPEMGHLFTEIQHVLKSKLSVNTSDFNPTLLNPSSSAHSDTQTGSHHEGPTPSLASESFRQTPLSVPPFQSNLSSSPKAVVSSKINEPPIFPPNPVLIAANHSHLEFMQILNTYIILKSDTGCLIIDQHAAHERILYERFKSVALNDSDSQPLLIASSIQVDPKLMDVFQRNKEALLELCFDIEEFGTDSLRIRAVPILLTGVHVDSLVLELLNDLLDTESVPSNLSQSYKEILQMKACKAAIKAGKVLSVDEIKHLCTELIESPNNFTCPHGRPLFINFNQSSLESLFLRT